MRTLGFLALMLAGCTHRPVERPPLANQPAADAQTGVAPIETLDDTDAGNGEDTVLTAKRWKYAAFFSRLKRAISQSWDPVAAWNALPASDRASYGSGDRVTKVLISVAPDGTLQQVQIASSSAVKALDDEALRAVTAAAPFGRPPEDITMPFAFSFFFEVGTGSKRTGP